ncbi:MAG: hypothetical protein O3A29_22875, partial [Planctomycetota bacterium]|nr:hypothetical protein [Planctomycetota bacterium]
MIKSVRIVQILVIVELFVVVGDIAFRAMRPAFPPFDSTVIDHLTAQSLNRHFPYGLSRETLQARNGSHFNI